MKTEVTSLDSGHKLERVWVLFGNYTMQEIFNHKPSRADIQDFAFEKGWTVEAISNWTVQEWSLRNVSR